jgi:hypothetical protein
MNPQRRIMTSGEVLRCAVKRNVAWPTRCDSTRLPCCSRQLSRARIVVHSFNEAREPTLGKKKLKKFSKNFSPLESLSQRVGTAWPDRSTKPVDRSKGLLVVPVRVPAVVLGQPVSLDRT